MTDFVADFEAYMPDEFWPRFAAAGKPCQQDQGHEQARSPRRLARRRHWKGQRHPQSPGLRRAKLQIGTVTVGHGPNDGKPKPRAGSVACQGGAALDRLEAAPSAFRPAAIRAHAQHWGPARFEREFQHEVDALLEAAGAEPAGLARAPSI